MVREKKIYITEEGKEFIDEQEAIDSEENWKSSVSMKELIEKRYGAIVSVKRENETWWEVLYHGSEQITANLDEVISFLQEVKEDY